MRGQEAPVSTCQRCSGGGRSSHGSSSSRRQQQHLQRSSSNKRQQSAQRTLSLKLGPGVRQQTAHDLGAGQRGCERRAQSAKRNRVAAGTHHNSIGMACSMRRQRSPSRPASWHGRRCRRTPTHLHQVGAQEEAACGVLHALAHLHHVTQDQLGRGLVAADVARAGCICRTTEGLS